jgi:hypothetical protein
MTWNSPNLSKKDIEMITLSLDEYIYYSEQDRVDVYDFEKLLIRLNEHLQKY